MPTLRRSHVLVLGLVFAASCASTPDSAEETPEGADVQVWSAPVQVGTVKRSDPVGFRENEAPDPEEEEEKDGEWLAAPIPFANPTLGAGLGFFGGYIFPLDSDDEVSPPSTAGVGGFYASNGSWGVFAGMRGYAAEDTWRFKGGVIYAALNLDFYGVGHSAGERGEHIALKQEAYGGLIEVMRSIGWKSFIGPRASAWKVVTSFREETELTDQIPKELLTAQIVALGVNFERDSRDSVFYPTEGMLFSLMLDSYKEAWGSDEQYDVWESAYNQYVSLAERTVLAGRLYGRFTFGDAPYYGLSLFGERSDLRGYNAGQYRDRMLLAGQLEVRHFFADKFGAVAFGGVGEVSPELTKWSLDELLPSLGAALRYTIAEENKVNFRFDVAWGAEGWAWYFGIGEAF